MLPRQFVRNHNDSFQTYANEFGLTLNEYRLIIRTFGRLLMRSIQEEGKVYYLPFRTGSLGVYKIPTSKRGVFNYEHYKHTGEKIYIRNYHSSSYAATFR